MAEAHPELRMRRAHIRHPKIIKANNRFRILLGSLVAMMLLAPLLQSEIYGLAAIRIIESSALMGAVYAISRKRRDLMIGAIIAAPVIIGRLFPSYSTSLPVFETVTAGTAVFLAFVAYKIIAEVAHLRTVTFDTIFGAACGYLLIGALWAFLYSMINVSAHPGFVFTNTPDLPPGADLVQRSRLISLFYFSFITLTSTGFGDILPIAPIAKGLAVIEVIIGQFYVAILVARLVSLEIISSSLPSGESEN
jgi:voltage-gated potassium channel